MLVAISTVSNPITHYLFIYSFAFKFNPVIVIRWSYFTSCQIVYLDSFRFLSHESYSEIFSPIFEYQKNKFLRGFLSHSFTIPLTFLLPLFAKLNILIIEYYLFIIVYTVFFVPRNSRFCTLLKKSFSYKNSIS